MPGNGTWAEMIALGMDVTVYCVPCNRRVELDLMQFPPHEPAIGRGYMCTQCGGKGQPICSSASNKDRRPS
jgi:DNA-directed RNA polymerase subunit RPC12/RpoP